jgi:hypothetical protein
MSACGRLSSVASAATHEVIGDCNERLQAAFRVLLRFSELVNAIGQPVHAIGQNHLRGEELSVLRREHLVMLNELFVLRDQTVQNGLHPIEAGRSVVAHAFSMTDAAALPSLHLESQPTLHR